MEDLLVSLADRSLALEASYKSKRIREAKAPSLLSHKAVTRAMKVMLVKIIKPRVANSWLADNPIKWTAA